MTVPIEGQQFFRGLRGLGMEMHCCSVTVVVVSCFFPFSIDGVMKHMHSMLVLLFHACACTAIILLLHAQVLSAGVHFAPLNVYSSFELQQPRTLSSMIVTHCACAERRCTFESSLDFAATLFAVINQSSWTWSWFDAVYTLNFLWTY